MMHASWRAYYVARPFRKARVLCVVCFYAGHSGMFYFYARGGAMTEFFCAATDAGHGDEALRLGRMSPRRRNCCSCASLLSNSTGQGGILNCSSVP